jgi:exodeoxyribonuclease VII small subunit
MADDSHTFASTRTRLEEIVGQVRKKDTSLEKSLDLLEEGVRLANACTELIDQQDWGVTAPVSAEKPGVEPVAHSEASAKGEPALADEIAVVEPDGERESESDDLEAAE